MKCAWKAFLNLLPPRLKIESETIGYDILLELRLRCGQAPEFVTTDGSVWPDLLITKEDIHFVINIASQYSAWASSTAAEGFITALGGHRIGLCGQMAVNHGVVNGVRNPTSLCIRISKEISGIADNASHLQGSVLILGRPGSGKTTLLRDMIRQRSQNSHITVIDSREELFPIYNGSFCFDPGLRTDVISCCSKSHGIDIAIRCMNPDYIAVDEITADKDCHSLINAGWCGVSLLATAHASSIDDLYSRPIYRPLVDNMLFENIIVMRPDRTWHTERIKLC